MMRKNVGAVTLACGGMVLALNLLLRCMPGPPAPTDADLLPPGWLIADEMFAHWPVLLNVQLALALGLLLAGGGILLRQAWARWLLQGVIVFVVLLIVGLSVVWQMSIPSSTNFSELVGPRGSVLLGLFLGGFRLMGVLVSLALVVALYKLLRFLARLGQEEGN